MEKSYRKCAPKVSPRPLFMHDIINYSTSICPFESEKCGKEEKNLQKSECLEKEKNVLDEIKNIFHSF